MFGFSFSRQSRSYRFFVLFYNTKHFLVVLALFFSLIWLVDYRTLVLFSLSTSTTRGRAIRNMEKKTSLSICQVANVWASSVNQRPLLCVTAAFRFFIALICRARLEEKQQQQRCLHRKEICIVSLCPCLSACLVQQMPSACSTECRDNDDDNKQTRLGAEAVRIG